MSVSKTTKLFSKKSIGEFDTVDITMTLEIKLLFRITQCVKLKKNFVSCKRRNLKLLGGQAVESSLYKTRKSEFSTHCSLDMLSTCLLSYL